MEAMAALIKGRERKALSPRSLLLFLDQGHFNESSSYTDCSGTQSKPDKHLGATALP